MIMAAVVKTLLKRNLHEVFGERNNAKRRAVIDELFTSDCIFSDPRGRFYGREALDQAVYSLQAEFPEYIFTERGDPQSLQDAGQLAWGFGQPGRKPQVIGTDVILVSVGRITALYNFLETLWADMKSSDSSNGQSFAGRSHKSATGLIVTKIGGCV